MRALVQRVTESKVSVDGAVVGQIGPGLLILFCAMEDDDSSLTAKLAAKISKLRIFPDDTGKMNRSLVDTGGGALIVSQFTLSADLTSGNRPGFSKAAAPDIGRRLYETFVDDMTSLGIPTQTGSFGADMAVHLINDGPVTIWMDM